MSEPVDLTIEGRPQRPRGARLVLTLSIAAMLAGLVLAAAYQLTLPRIQANRARALRRAVFEVVPGAKSMRRLTVRDGRLVVADGAAAAGGEGVYAVYDEGGRFAGYAIEAEGPGFQDTIRLLFGYDPRTKRVTGMFVLESRETPGLGDRIYKDPKFRGQFRSLKTEPRVRLVKGGRHAENEVDAITGATISSRSVVNILNKALSRWKPVLDASEPPPAAAQESQHG